MKTKTILSGLTTIFMMVSISACNAPAEKETKEADHEHHATIEPQGKLKFNNDKLNAIYPYYLELQEALVLEDIPAARKAALAIEEGAKKGDALPGLQAPASEMVEETDIDRQREYFQSMTEALVGEVKRSGLDSGEVYIAHCPMAFENKGADWLTSSEEIRNPYYGETMLTCGSVKETI